MCRDPNGRLTRRELAAVAVVIVMAPLLASLSQVSYTVPFALAILELLIIAVAGRRAVVHGLISVNALDFLHK
jgi:hypothetical protein